MKIYLLMAKEENKVLKFLKETQIIIFLRVHYELIIINDKNHFRGNPNLKYRQ